MKDDPISHKNAIQISTNVTHDIGFSFKRRLLGWWHGMGGGGSVKMVSIQMKIYRISSG